MMTKYDGLSVLMSIYKKENPRFVAECFDSLLAQTVPADEWVVVEDGPLTDGLYEVLGRYEAEHPGLMHRVPLAENQGLGLALRHGVTECSHELIARMDTDDVCDPTRFERQLACFEANPELDICGSHISEFETSPDEVVDVRRVPLNDASIRRYQRMRDGFNHVTVMFRKSAVLRAGNYQHALLMEDSLLWANMFLTGARGMNIDDYLVHVRVGSDMYERRGGFNYFKKYRKGRRQILETGFITRGDYITSLAVQLVVALVPNRVRRLIFTRALRSRDDV